MTPGYMNRIRAGVVEVQQESADSKVVEVRAPKGWEHEIVVEDPPAPRSGFVLMAALAAFTLVACVCAPWRSDRRAAIWLVFFLASFHAMFWAAQCVATTGDSPRYLGTLAGNLAGCPQYFPPGYPAFLGLIELFSGENHGRYIALVQHVLAIAAACWTYLVTKRLVSLELALFAGILAGTLSPVSTMSQTVMTEIPTLFGMVGALYFGVRSAETGYYRFAVVAGTLTGWGGLLRAVPLTALLPAVGLLLWIYPTQRRLRLRMPRWALPPPFCWPIHALAFPPGGMLGGGFARWSRLLRSD